MLVFVGLLILAIATALLPLLFVIVQLLLSQKQTVKRPAVHWILVGLLSVSSAFVMKVLLVSQLELDIPLVLPTKLLERVDSASNTAKSHLFRGAVLPGIPRHYQWEALPSEAPYPSNNSPTPAKVALGKMLFTDSNLSVDGTVSCATCHDLQSMAGADGRAVAQGVGGQKGLRNTPTVWNSAFQKSLFWDGRASSLEQQALQPMLNPVEMGMPSEQAIIDRLARSSEYRKAFHRAFGESDITINRVTKALASYQRTLITNDSPYDDFVRGDKTALSERQLNGMVLFEKSGCVFCHNGPNFSVASVYNSGLSLRLFPANPSPITEHLALSEDGSDKPGVWRVPSLRNVALTGPWLHNGSVDKLEDVVRIMAVTQLGKGSDRQVSLANKQLMVVENPMLTDDEVQDIVAFLHALSSKRLAEVSDNRVVGY